MGKKIKEPRSMASILSGKTAVITGSISGIGHAIALAFAREGANVVLNGLEPAEKVADACEQVRKAGGQVLYIPKNDANPDEVRALIRESIAAFGGVDILVNNAGVQHVENIETFPAEKWKLILNLNLSAAFHATQEAIPSMKARGWGRIINTASVHGVIASTGKAAYVAAKHGLLGLTKVIALDLAAYGITANAICPGYVDTPMVRKQIPEQAKTFGLPESEVIEKVLLKEHALKEFVTPEAVASMALYLCADAARAITGTSLMLDGGWTAH
jgi:3-hydroxybutyrate dehydrogenase